MRFLPALLLVAALTAAVSCKTQSEGKKEIPDPTIAVSSDDSEMNAAIAKARATLPDFYKHMQHPGPGETEFALKLRITEGLHAEHFWLVELKGAPGHLTGMVNNDPEYVHTVKLGDRIPIPEDQITDWLYMRNGKMVGNRTVRPLFNQMSPEEVKKMKGLLQDP